MTGAIERRATLPELTGTVVVTGASSGIGLATARAFADAGAALVLAGRAAERLDRAAEDCRARGAQVLAVPTDATDAAQVEALAEAAAERFGRIDVWVDDAGTSLWGPFEEIPTEVHVRLVETDLLGVVHGCGPPPACRSRASCRGGVGCWEPRRTAGAAPRDLSRSRAPVHGTTSRGRRGCRTSRGR